jgi:signal peptidase I
MWLKVVKNSLLLPLLLVRDVFSFPRKVMAKVSYFFLVLIFFGSAWLIASTQVFYLAKISLFELGILDRLTKVDVRGDSMLPTITNGSQIELNSPKKYPLARGDIVSFKNIETGFIYYLKRIVGLPGEEISIKNGHLTINNRILKEDYVLNDLPTFGNTFLVECSSYTIPKNHYLVLGDNRTVSLDSRVLGFVKKEDIDGVIKKNQEAAFIDEARQKEILKAALDEPLLLKKVNEARQKAGVNPLIVNPLLNETAKKRAASIAANFSDWKRQSVPLALLLKEEDYQYNLIHEFITFGYLDEKSVVKQMLESSPDALALLSKNSLEIGLGTIEKANESCTFPLIVITISWPSVPTYSPEIVAFWQEQVDETQELLTILQSFVGVSGFNQVELRELIDLVAESSNIATSVLEKINSQVWLDYQEINRFYELAEEAQPKIEAFLAQVEANLPSLPPLE